MTVVSSVGGVLGSFSDFIFLEEGDEVSVEVDLDLLGALGDLARAVRVAQ